MFGNDEDWVLDFRIEYYTQRADMSGGDEDGEEPKDPIGRILRFPLSLRFTASLQVNISFFVNTGLYKIVEIETLQDSFCMYF